MKIDEPATLDLKFSSLSSMTSSFITPYRLSKGMFERDFGSDTMIYSKIQVDANNNGSTNKRLALENLPPENK